jgi:signal transduction histidine kinase
MKIRIPVFLRLGSTAVLLLVILGVAGVWTLKGIQSEVNSRLADSLQTVLNTADEGLRNWVRQTEIDVAAIAETEELRTDVEAQLLTARDRNALLHATALKNIRRLLMPVMKLRKLAEFSVIAPDGIQIASARDEYVGSREIVESTPGLLAKVMNGMSFLGLPVGPSTVRNHSTSQGLPFMTASAPILDQTGKPIAILTFGFDPRDDFTETTRMGRLGKTGETYAFDRNGRLLTASRFRENQTSRSAPLPQESALSIEIRDPGGNIDEGFRPTVPHDQQPLTRMAQSATRGEAGVDLNGYRDYRGVPVVGSWRWDEELGMGLAIEMDLAEAYAPSVRIRNLAIFMLLLIVSVIATLLLILRRRARLLAANQAYREALRAREDMMAIVSHDLKNPINSIVLRSHLMIQKVERSADPDNDLKHNLQLINRTAFHMNSLISDLTDVAKMQAGQLHVAPQEIPGGEVAQPAIETILLLAKEKQIEFVHDVASDLPMVCVEQFRMTQILGNLLGNAVKFTPKGGRVELTVRGSGDKVLFSVCDTGPGIPSAALSHIFEPYWQVSKTRSGMGLGLFIAKTLVEAHAGRIWVESTVGQGTAFHFTIPAIRPNAQSCVSTGDVERV